MRIERDEVKLEFVEPTGSKETTPSLGRIKWPLQLSSSFSERVPLEDVIRRFVDIKSR